jgi:hypothetical protein
MNNNNYIVESQKSIGTLQRWWDDAMKTLINFKEEILKLRIWNGWSDLTVTIDGFKNDYQIYVFKKMTIVIMGCACFAVSAT